MTTEITTLEQAGKHLVALGVVDFNTMTVEGKQLLEVCGYSTTNSKARIDEQIKKHKFTLEKDFTVSKVRDGKHNVNIYQFTMNAANHVLLTAYTDQGKAARQQAINTQVAVDSNQELRDMLMQVMQSQKDTLAKLEAGYVSLIGDRDDLIIKKSQPLSLSKLLGNGSSKVVQATNLWLEDEGYQTMRFIEGQRAGWSVTTKGRQLGTQINPASIFWIPELKMELPSTEYLLTFAERLGLKDMKIQD